MYVKKVSDFASFDTILTNKATPFEKRGDRHKSTILP